MSEEEPTGIHCRLDELLEQGGMTLTRLGELVGVSIVNLSVL
jgi:putative transcriptional regulator